MSYPVSQSVSLSSSYFMKSRPLTHNSQRKRERFKPAAASPLPWNAAAAALTDLGRLPKLFLRPKLIECMAFFWLRLELFLAVHTVFVRMMRKAFKEKASEWYLYKLHTLMGSEGKRAKGNKHYNHLLPFAFLSLQRHRNGAIIVKLAWVKQ